ncbi:MULTISPECIES: EF-hand domain-containing protein [Pseudomonas]|uniref:EF-hand domain-containing protein n=1 Tax=Pseudomonas peradeniyensis TaxID=2745488 RepID=A0ABT2V5I7_9PSED|nr:MULTISPECIES: EF-hand domain-containing protein [Pseudomonas]MCU7236767.1 EF-hand domain-containing protein [Pseudomonas peradeniyensis]MCU7281791.1 EF-hand domain-containing protein [Pseudomonas peradeniyensis]QZA52474.1 EF-hand domain-containing protein [Pseudomonas sp. 2hn]
MEDKMYKGTPMKTTLDAQVVEKSRPVVQIQTSVVMGLGDFYLWEYVFKPLDRNRDGVVAVSEIRRYFHEKVQEFQNLESEFRKVLDENGDGVVTLEEFLECARTAEMEITTTTVRK